MKLRKDIYFEKLEEFGYQYQENVVYPTYRKTKVYGNSLITIDIATKDRTIFINKSSHITEKNNKFIIELIKANMIEK